MALMLQIHWIKRIMSIFSQSHSSPRINLFFIAIFFKIIASALSAIGFVLLSPAFTVSGTFVWLFFFTVLFLVASPGVDAYLKDRLRWLKPTAITIAVLFCVISLVLIAIAVTIGIKSLGTDKPEAEISRLMTSLDNVYGYNDATALSHQAAENLLDGKNPYALSNIVTATIEYNAATDKLTPLRVGRFADVFPYPTADQLKQLWQEAAQDPTHVPPELESKFNYPAACFLLPAPFVWLGVGDLRFVFIILLVPALAYVIYKVPGCYRLIFIAALIASVELWNSLAGGETGFLYFPFLLLAWVLYRRHIWISAICMAVAIATKQITWFLLPFYFIVIFRTMDAKRTLGVIGIVVGVFIAANAWFIAADPSLWLSSIFAPVTENMFPLGVGIISLVTSGLVTIDSPLIFSIIEIVVLFLAIVWYYFNCRRYPDTAPVLSVLPLFFAWRSLWGYFFYFDIIMLAAILINEYGRRTSERLEITPALTTAR
jgi:hypothetical protein